MINNFYDKVHACWIGKNIGGTLGGPYEGWASKLNIEFFQDFEEGKPLPNDDLDLQLLNLHAIEQHGCFLTVNEIAEEWKEHVFFPYDEYGYAALNLRRGMKPPFSGLFNNTFRNCMGSPIRSELWAAIAAGKPNLAAYYAFQDASVDHPDGEGIYGEVFFTVLECLAYENNDVFEIINKALSYIPKDCTTACALNDTVKWFNEGVSYDDIRDNILSKYQNDNFTDAPQNIAFTIVGLLYGKDFEDVLLKAVNMGYDTDCTAATVASIYGILHGTAGIPEKWSRPVGEDILVSPEVKGLDYPTTIEELTERTVAVHKLLEDETGEDLFNPCYMGFDWQCMPVSGTMSRNADFLVFVRGVNGNLVQPNEEKKVQVRFVNRSAQNWNLTAKFENGNEVFENVTVEAHSTKELIFTLPTDYISMQTVVNTLLIQRLHDFSLWALYEVKVVLPYASTWTVDGQTEYCENGAVILENSGSHTLKTTLKVPTTRTMLLTGACNEPYQVYMDGELTINCEDYKPCMPAFHRESGSRVHEMVIAAGVHDIRVELVTKTPNTEFALLPVAPRNISEPGRNYYHIDCEIGV